MLQSLQDSLRTSSAKKDTRVNLVSISSLAAFVFMGILGVAGGTAVSYKIVDQEAAQITLYCGGGWVCLGGAVLGLLLSSARRSAISHQLFIGLGVNVGAASILLGISSPIFWLGIQAPVIGIAVSALFLLVLIYQIRRAYANFHDCWQRNNKSALNASYNAERGVIDIENLLQQLGVHADLLLPTRSETVATMIKAVLIIAMLAGFRTPNKTSRHSANR